ncbi:hypothetical protein GCM10011297_27730 [Bacterioplanes sanyensis]|uniref:DUF962 domain-containing protein n=1 Tax=Bacterioplanes sanyensis TaxID=1249553 RepID=UPI00167645E8|nr:DUF962 domain-containing protein [Bacterioplanes sanyensis]GGY53355.1 hypothetical protein GCM10011297_27730 [Bacterioplanes sanyensis]
MSDSKEFSSFAEFYPYYLAEHDHPVCRALHYSGSLSALAVVVFCVMSAAWLWLPLALLLGYGQAWIGHFFFEHNKPATFRYPLWSFMGDWVMLKDWLSGRLPRLLADRHKP